MPSFFRLLLVLPVCLIIGSCSRVETPDPGGTNAEQHAGAPGPAEEPARQEAAAEPCSVPDIWQPVLERLRGDGLDSEEIAYLFVRLGEQASQDPMGRKVEELYKGKFMPRPNTGRKSEGGTSAGGIPRPWYKGVVTDTNARRCRTFINTHARAFQAAEETYAVPPEVAASLLFVETRLGDYLGEHDAFITLASMAASRQPDDIADWLGRLPGVENRMDWVSERMQDKADWAYTELRALLTYCLENGIDPFDIPGSAYGAIGLCQFMPSNLPRYAVDGNGDGIVDLFDPADAVTSLCHYLARHGWKAGLSVAEQVKVLRRYNNLAIYANTILALAEKVKEIPGRPAVNRALPRPPAAVVTGASDRAGSVDGAQGA